MAETCSEKTFSFLLTPTNFVTRETVFKGNTKQRVTGC
jgi:hypothetical protein